MAATQRPHFLALALVMLAGLATTVAGVQEAFVQCATVTSASVPMRCILQRLTARPLHLIQHAQHACTRATALLLQLPPKNRSCPCAQCRPVHWHLPQHDQDCWHFGDPRQPLQDLHKVVFKEHCVGGQTVHGHQHCWDPVGQGQLQRRGRRLQLHPHKVGTDLLLCPSCLLCLAPPWV